MSLACTDAMHFDITQVRIDTRTKRASVLDFLRCINPKLSSSNAATTVKRLVAVENWLGKELQPLRINGKGRETLTATPETLAHMAFLLPGNAGRQVRREAARVLVRYAGGDTTLIDEIEHRYKHLDTAKRQFLLSGQTKAVIEHKWDDHEDEDCKIIDLGRYQ